MRWIISVLIRTYDACTYVYVCLKPLDVIRSHLARTYRIITSYIVRQGPVLPCKRSESAVCNEATYRQRTLPNFGRCYYEIIIIIIIISSSSSSIIKMVRIDHWQLLVESVYVVNTRKWIMPLKEPCGKCLERWPRTLRTTYWAAPVPWRRWSWPDTR